MVKELIGGSKIEEAIVAFELFKENFPGKKLTVRNNVLNSTFYALARADKIVPLKKFYNFRLNNFPDAQKSLEIAVYMAIVNGSVLEGVKVFEAHRNNSDYQYTEGQLNTIGYLFLQSGKNKEAIAVFKMNVSAFPKSWNVYDSLGEAYLADGNKPLAKKNYKKSLDLNAENTYAHRALKEL